MRSPSRLVQTQVLTLIKVLAPFTGHAAEHMLVKALESLPCNAMHVTGQDESSDQKRLRTDKSSSTKQMA